MTVPPLSISAVSLPFGTVPMSQLPGVVQSPLPVLLQLAVWANAGGVEASKAQASANAAAKLPHRDRQKVAGRRLLGMIEDPRC
jgi:hypothetical protein